MPQPSLHAHVYELSRAVHAEPESPLLAQGFGGGAEAPGTTPHVSGSWMHVVASAAESLVLQPSLHAHVYELSRAVHADPVSPRLAHGLGGGLDAPGITPQVSARASSMHIGASAADPTVPQPSLHVHVYELSRAVHADPVSPLLAHGFGGGVEPPGTTPHVSGS